MIENEKYMDDVLVAGNLENEVEEIFKLSESSTDIIDTFVGLCGLFTISGC